MRPTKPSPKRRAVLNERAHAMRHAPTPSEAALFRLLSGGKMGVGFKRQVPLGGYIADCVAASVKLVVEVDGPVHAQRRGADARKDRALRRLGSCSGSTPRSFSSSRSSQSRSFARR